MKDSFINKAGLLFVSMIFVNAGNYAINLILGRLLGPEDFAEVSVLTSLVLMVSFMALGLQLSGAKFIASEKSGKTGESLVAVASWFRRKSLWLGVMVTVIAFSLVLPITSFLKFESWWSLGILIAGIPIYLLMSVNRGILQGFENIGQLALTYIAEMAGRAIMTFILIAVCIMLTLGRFTESTAVGFLFSFVIAYLFSRKDASLGKSTKISSGLEGNIYKFVLVVSFYEFAQILINNSDLILVKHYFDNYEAGLYAGLALIGRVIFFATWSVVTLLIPRVVRLQKMGLPHNKILIQSFIFVLLTAVLITAGCFLFSKQIMEIFFGQAYASIHHLLWKYALATSMFASANVFAYYYMSLDQYVPVLLSIIAGVAQVIFITLFHSSIMQVISVQIVLMSALLLSMVVYHILKGIKNEKTQNSYRFSVSSGDRHAE